MNNDSVVDHCYKETMHQTVDNDEHRKLFNETWPKHCGCGESFTEDQWEALHYVGVQKSGLDDYPDLELRNCGHCMSTLAIVVPGDFVKQ